MLYDPKKWAMPEVQPEAPKLEPWQKLLLDAVAILELRGWCRGNYEDVGGRVCAMGAINLAAGMPSGATYSLGGTPLSPRRQAVEKLTMHINHSCVENWNDNKHRTGQQVIEAFRTAAKS